MSEVLMQTYTNQEFLYTYQILEERDGTYRVWKSTGPITGGFINNGERYDTALSALQALVAHVDQGE